MRVTAKFVAVMVLVLVIIRSFEGALTVRRETARLEENVWREASIQGRMLRAFVSEAWLRDGRERAMELLKAVNPDDDPLHVSWRPLTEESEVLNRIDSEELARLKRGDMVTFRGKARQGEGDIQYFLVPVDVPDAGGAMLLAEPLLERSRYINHAVTREAIAAGVVILFSSVGIVLIGLAVVGRPLDILQKRVHQIGEGEMSEEVSLGGHDELSSLADGLNEMCRKLVAAHERVREATEKRIAAMEQVRHVDRLTTIGRLASGIAHELGTPLNVICGRAEMIANGRLSVPRVTENALTIKSQGDLMANLIRRLLDFARRRPPKRKHVNVMDIINEAVYLVNCLGYENGVRLDCDEQAASLYANVDPGQIQQVMTNLLENALQAMPKGGDVSVRIRSVTLQPSSENGFPGGRYLKIAVIDSGSGIPEEYRHKVFDSFFTTKNDSGQGTGLGLSIAYGIVAEHGGWIEVDSEMGKGSSFIVHIPQGDD